MNLLQYHYFFIYDQAATAHNEDKKNQTSEQDQEPAPEASARPVAPGPGRRATLATTITYNIVSDNVLGSGQFGTVYEALEEGSDRPGHILRKIKALALRTLTIGRPLYYWSPV